MSPFCIVLVRPEIAENLGFIARSMLAFGATDLRIVGEAAQEKLLRPQSPAWKTASGGENILQEVKLFPCLQDAVADCHGVLGFSRRSHLDAPMHELGSVFATLNESGFSASSRLALVFGPESQGLQAEDGESIQHWVRIDYPHPSMSLNLSHAITIVLYAFHSHAAFESAKDQGPLQAELMQESESQSPATRKLMQHGLDILVQACLDRKVFPSGMEAAKTQHLRGLWKRMTLQQGEAEFLIGILKKICLRP